MPNKPKTSHHSRLHILTEDEIRDIFHLPAFTNEERLLYFSLTQTEFETLGQNRSFASKLNFILQLGYFKSRHLFFNFEFSDVSSDVSFICRKYFPDEKFELQNLPNIAVNTSIKHRRTICELHNYQFCESSQRNSIKQTAQNAVKISGKPIYIFREILNFLETHRIILPGYSFLQDTISKALILEEQRLSMILQEKLTTSEIKQLDELLSDAEGKK